MAGVYHAVAINFLIKESLVATKRETNYFEEGGIYTSEFRSWTPKAYANLLESGLISGIGVNWPLTEKLDLGIEIRPTIGLFAVPRKYEKYGFQAFSNTTRNISFEFGIKLQHR